MCLPGLVLVVALAAAPAASAASGCQKGKERKLGATYVTKVTVTGTDCAAALKVVKAFHTCRKKSANGKCKSTVKGYKCTEKRPAALKIPTQYTGDVTCKSGAKRVFQEYQQDT
jgi:hypothetical protein